MRLFTGEEVFTQFLDSHTDGHPETERGHEKGGKTAIHFHRKFNKRQNNNTIGRKRESGSFGQNIIRVKGEREYRRSVRRVWSRLAI